MAILIKGLLVLVKFETHLPLPLPLCESHFTKCEKHLGVNEHTSLGDFSIAAKWFIGIVSSTFKVMDSALNMVGIYLLAHPWKHTVYTTAALCFSFYI